MHNEKAHKAQLWNAAIVTERWHVQAGAGVVADSVPAMEQAECEHKSRALFRAAEEAIRVAQSSDNL